MGVILYVLLSGMLPFDDEENREIARKVIYEPVSFKNRIWDFVSNDAKELIKGLLQKDRHKRITLEEVLNHPWVTKRNQGIADLRRKSDDFSKFPAYCATLEEQISKAKDEGANV